MSLFKGSSRICGTTWGVCRSRSNDFKVAGVTNPHKCEDLIQPGEKNHGSKDNPHHCCGSSCSELKSR